jgi:hypothetical protein
MEDANEYNKLGDAAREWVTSDESMMSARKMCENIIEGFEETFKKWTPRSTFDFYKIEDLEENYLKHPVAENE